MLGLPFGQVNKVAELIPNNPAKPVTLQQAIDGEPRLQAMRGDDEGVRRMLEIALQLEGLYRHASTHAAGVVIGDRPLIDLVPLYRDPRSDFLVTQYSMKHVEQAGLVKFDFLGLTTLTILERAAGFLRELGVEVDLAHLPLDDAKTYEMLARGDAGGVFQFEGQGMRDALRQMRPDRFEDLIALGALYRPGPMANIPEYCRRKHGEAWQAPHPSIHDILEETYGIMVYQEQVLQIAQRMAGYSLGSADLLRRAMGKNFRAEMEAQRKTFVEGAIARGIDEAKATEVFELMAEVCRLRFQQVTRCRLRAGGVSDCVDEGEPPGGVPCRLHESGDGQYRSAGRLEAGGGEMAFVCCPRHQPLGSRFQRRASARRTARHPLRPGRGEEGRPGGDAGAGGDSVVSSHSQTFRISRRASIRARSTACRSKI